MAGQSPEEVWTLWKWFIGILVVTGIIFAIVSTVVDALGPEKYSQGWCEDLGRQIARDWA